MKVILQEDVKKLGAKGDVVEVSDGYGRNYLLPRKLAVEANAANLNNAKVNAENKARKLRQEADHGYTPCSDLKQGSKEAQAPSEGYRLSCR